MKFLKNNFNKMKYYYVFVLTNIFFEVSNAQDTAKTGLGLNKLDEIVKNKTSEIGISNKTSVVEVVMNILSWVFGFLGLVAVGIALYGGFQILVSQGKPEARTEAAKMFLNAVLGIMVIVFAYTITNWLLSGIIGSAA